MSNYNDSGAVVAVVLGGTDLPLPSGTPVGITANGSNTAFTVPTTGAYELSYCVRLTTALLVSAQLTINGSPGAGLSYSPSTSQSQLCRAGILSMSAGDTVSLQLFGLLGAATLSSPGGAELLIKKIN